MAVSASRQYIFKEHIFPARCEVRWFFTKTKKKNQDNQR